MQAPSNSRASAVAISDSRPTLVRMLIALLATVTLLLIFRPSVVRAQDPVKPVPAAKPVPSKPEAVTHPAPVAHTPPAAAVHPPVITGSAPGALAEQTVGKSDAPPKEPLRAAPHAVRPAVKTTVSSSPAPVGVKPAARIEATPAVADDDAGLAAFTSANLDPVMMELPRMWGPDASAMRRARRGEDVTVFISHALDAHQADVEVDALLPVKVPRPRSAEYASAPFAVSAETFTSAGVVGHQAAPVHGIVARMTAAATKTEPTPRRFQLLDETEVTLPLGAVAEVGRRFVTVDGDRLLRSTTLIAIPTGVLEIVKINDAGVVFARVVQLAGAVQEGQRLVALEGTAMVNGLEVTAVSRASTAPETEVVWVGGDGLLPSLQSYLVLGAGELQGVKVGDQFALVKRFGLGPDAVEQRVAVVRVVRVTAFGSSAIVVRQDQPGIGVGSAARLIGRVQ